MATIQTLFKITAAVSGANAVKELGDAVSKVSTNGENLKRSFSGVGVALKAFAASEAIGGITSMIKGQIDLADHMNDLRQRTGVAVETLSEYKVAAEKAGTSLDDVASAIQKFEKNTIAAQSATSEQRAAFNALGISITGANGGLKSSQQLMDEIADRFAKTNDGASKTAVAIALFGKAGANMIPMLNEGSESLHKFNAGIDQEFAEAADRFNDNMTVIRNNMNKLVVLVAKEITPGLVKITDGFTENSKAVEVVTVAIKVLETAFVGLEQIGSFVTTYLGSQFALLANDIGVVVDKAKAVGTLDFGKLKEIGDNGNSQRIAIMEEMRAKMAKDNADYQAQMREIWNPTQQPKQTPKPQADKGDIKYNPAAATKGASETESATKALKEYIAKLNESNKTLAQEADYVGMASVEIEKLKDARKMDAEWTEKTVNMSPAVKAAFQQQFDAAKKARQELIHANYEMQHSAAAGAANFFRDYSEAAKDSAAQIKKVLTDAFNGVEDALVNFVTTGKLSFKDLANSIIKDLARIVVQQTITGPLAKALGGSFVGASSGGGSFISSVASLFATGGIMSSSGKLPLHAYSSGGIANKPQLALFGEGRMNEAYVPLPDGKRIPVNLTGGGSQQQNNVTVNVSVDGSGTSVQGNSGKASDLGKAIAAAVKAQLIDEKRPGGLLAAA